MRLSVRYCTIFAAAILQGCGSPHYDVKYTNDEPDITDIATRIQCEIADMLRDKSQSKDGNVYNHRDKFIFGNYEIAASLNLGVTQSIGATPTFGFTHALAAGRIFKFGIGAELSGSRDDNMSATMFFSVAETVKALKDKEAYLDCPSATSNLAGDLDLQSVVSANMPLHNVDKTKAGAAGQFGKTITFTLTENLNGVGPTWTMKEGTGPGGFGKIGRVYTNKLSIAFVEGAAHGKLPGPGDKDAARRALSDIKADDLIRTLNAARSGF